MEAKVKEEVPDKDYQPSTTDRRKSTTSKERRSPEQEEIRVSPTPGPASPQNNGTTGLSSTESLSPPLCEGARPALQRLRRFLSALQQFAPEGSADTGDRVRQLIFNLVAGTMSIEEFQAGVQECTNYPLRASVPGFLRALLPLAQRDLHARARRAKQTPLQYIRGHEHLVLEGCGEAADIFAHQHPMEPIKRRASDPFYEASQSNGSHEEFPPQAKRAPTNLLLNPSPFLCPLPSNASLFDYGHPYPVYHGGQEPAYERRDGGISVRDVSSMNASMGEARGGGVGGGGKGDDEWRNINTMLNCILSMVEKTKRALAILQQRGLETTESNEIKRAANEIMASAVRQTEERVAEVRRRAEDAVNQVKRQALLELQRAVGAAESKALELVTSERGKERRHTPPPQLPPHDTPAPAPQQNCCWNCGRKAQETCSGCGAARYCGAFCQHKDWENHHQVCSGRDQKPTALHRTSPPTSITPLAKTLPRATTPISATGTSQIPVTTGSETRLSLTTLNSAERLLANNQDRNLPSNSDRITLANLSTAQGLIGGIGGKK
ncbi:PREDICTED: protein CBFA2T3 [Papilio xuthus]|uniref:Protein CBFA2T2 n=1 Tax=Papilio xuthus TaxID=66420 RepID=A0A194QBU5_PAPXU|nr:PREDICTED: protein CBFA2T3 [Papilio xuthus]KPJ03028.1 Protein CBFA2T2 [Papilio xuthus]